MVEKQNELLKEALEELSDFRIRQAAILNLTDELRAVDMRLEQEGETDGAESLAKRRTRLFATLQLLKLETDRVSRAFETLEEREAYLLEQMYVTKAPVFDIMEALCIEKSAFYRLRKRALDTFVYALYGVRPA